MSAAGQESQAVAGGASNPPWYVRYTRWCQTSRNEAVESELAVLRLAAPQGAVAPAPAMVSRDVRVGPGPQDFLHTLSGGLQDAQPPVVLMPGYGAGVGFYYRNFPSLAARFRAYAVDWLGTGLSGRPRYTASSRAESEAFFLNSLAAWRDQMGFGTQKMVLVGHSLGGYLAAQYALKHPEQVQHLVLVCPAGVPKQPEDWDTRWMGQGWSWRGQMFRSFMWMWEKGVTPAGIVRTLGPVGRNIVYKYVSNRFSHHGEGLNASEVEVFKRYFYHIAALPGSGEYALRHLLAPGAWAHAPLEDSLHELKVPVTFIYGKEDWMRPEHAVRLCERLRKERAPCAPNDLSVEIIDDAGHFVFIDQPELFDKALANVVLPYLKGPEALRRAASDYSTAGVRVTVAEEQGAGAVPAGMPPSATSWGFAASGHAAAAAEGDAEGVVPGTAK